MSHDQDHDHDHGFHHDLPRMLGRRAMLLGLGGAAGLAAAGATAQTLSCFATVPEMAGPFPANGRGRRGANAFNVLDTQGILRRDIRPSFAGMTPTAQGTPFTLQLDLVNAGASCAPLEGLAVYVWQCDAAGRYSLYEDADRNYLRGMGLTDAQGRVSFQSIYPGCYSSRWPHIHFEVFATPEDAVSGAASLLVSQLALPEDASTATYAANPAYQASVPAMARQDFDRDMIWRDNTATEKQQIMTTLQGDAQAGFTGTAQIGLAV